jgi:S-disulfanyl-L-cysteine oxidoreductase SoxD
MPRMSSNRRAVATVLSTSAAAFLFVTSITVDAQAPPQSARTVQDGIFTDAQATRAQALYAQRCAGCHGPALEGAQAPPLTGDAFLNKFRLEPLSALFIQIRYTMPPTTERNAPPRLSPAEGADLVAHIFKSNGFPAGKAEFAASDAVNSGIEWPVRGAEPRPSAPRTSRPPAATLNQLMRGIFFHNSNLVFSIQEVEAADLPPPPPPSRPDGLTIFDWGLMIYTGWPAVENAAASLADASTLLLQPGLRCENGRSAPVTEPDWIRFTDRMISVAKRTYRLAQTRDKEAISEYTLDLSNACNACHLTYRDVGGRGRGRGGNPAGAGGSPAGAGGTAARCMHR